MEKPKLKSSKYFDFSECTAFIEKKYGIQTRDYANTHTHFGEWCDAKGYGNKDPKGQDRSSSQIWYAEFRREIEAGKIKERPYLDFWHWLMDVLDPQRGGTIKLDAELGEGAKPWQKEILALYLKEFGRGPYRT